MSSGFITESEALEARRRRQEEWDKVRTEDQPKEAPEEPYDNRPLYTCLEEQRLKKEAEYEEAHKLKNMIRGLDDEEVDFLDLVERTKAKAAQQISLEEQKEMQEFREKVSSLAETEEMQRLRAQIAPARPANHNAAPQSQKNKLQGMIVRKRKASEVDSDTKEKDAPVAKSNGLVSINNKNTPTNAPAQTISIARSADDIGALRCVGVLPGLGNYDTDTSSDTDDSSDFESPNDKCQPKRDFLGRLPTEYEKKKEGETKS